MNKRRAEADKQRRLAEARFLLARGDAKFQKFFSGVLAGDYAMAYMRGFDMGLDTFHLGTAVIPNPYLMVEEKTKHEAWHDGLTAAHDYLFDVFAQWGKEGDKA